MITLETDRLSLRMFRDSDITAVAEWTADPVVMRYIGDGVPMNRCTAWRAMASWIGHWHLRGYGFWAVEEKATQQLVGRVGFFNPLDWPRFELGWTLHPKHWHRGFATEAANAALNYAFNSMQRDVVSSFIHPDNTASIQVAERIGERLTGDVDLFGKRVRVYEITASEWSSRQSKLNDQGGRA
jgi:RimJ/RimL family protein N-acetyltransferase